VLRKKDMKIPYMEHETLAAVLERVDDQKTALLTRVKSRKLTNLSGLTSRVKCCD